MKRRTLLGRSAAAGAALALAGCLRRGRDENVLQLADSNFRENDDGYLVYVVTISNPSGRSAEATVYVNSQLNGNSSTQVRQVALDAHETTVLRVTYDTKYSEVRNFEPSVDIQEE